MTVIYIIIPERKQAFRSLRKNLQFQAVLQNIRHSSLMHQAMQHPNYTKFGATEKKTPNPKHFIEVKIDGKPSFTGKCHI